MVDNSVWKETTFLSATFKHFSKEEPAVLIHKCRISQWPQQCTVGAGWVDSILALAWFQTSESQPESWPTSQICPAIQTDLVLSSLTAVSCWLEKQPTNQSLGSRNKSRKVIFLQCKLTNSLAGKIATLKSSTSTGEIRTAVQVLRSQLTEITTLKSTYVSDWCAPLAKTDPYRVDQSIANNWLWIQNKEIS